MATSDSANHTTRQRGQDDAHGQVRSRSRDHARLQRAAAARLRSPQQAGAHEALVGTARHHHGRLRDGLPGRRALSIRDSQGQGPGICLPGRIPRRSCRPSGIVQTFEFEGMPGSISVETLTFTERDGKTTLTSDAAEWIRSRRGTPCSSPAWKPARPRPTTASRSLLATFSTNKLER